MTKISNQDLFNRVAHASQWSISGKFICRMLDLATIGNSGFGFDSSAASPACFRNRSDEFSYWCYFGSFSRGGSDVAIWYLLQLQQGSPDGVQRVMWEKIARLRFKTFNRVK